MSSVVRPFGAVGRVERRAVRRDSWARSAWAWLGQAWQFHTTRQALTELDDRALGDLGISRAQAQFEASRPFWDMLNRR